MPLQAEKNNTFGMQQQQMALMQALLSGAGQDRAQQAYFLNTMFNSAQPYLQGNIGFNPQMLAAMQGNTIDTTNNQFNSATERLKSMLARRGGLGGDSPISGQAMQGFGSLAAAQAQSLAGGLRNIDIANAQQATQNMWNAQGVIGGAAGQYGQTANSLQNASDAANSNAIQALQMGNQLGIAGKQMGFNWGALAGSLLGAGLNFATRGMFGGGSGGSMGNSKFGFGGSGGGMGSIGSNAFAGLGFKY